MTLRGFSIVLVIVLVASVFVNLTMHDRCDSMVATALASGTHTPTCMVDSRESIAGYAYILSCEDGTYTVYGERNGVGFVKQGFQTPAQAGAYADSMLPGGK